ncbi:MAG TPA: hypothetical protein VFS37_01230 [Conexibacter sp.]|nr:hypothetical protein [Conexibacter sp.]
MPSSPQHRRRRIRRTVGAASLAAFALAWGVIAGSGAMGHTSSSAAPTVATQGSQSSASSFDDDAGEQEQAQQRQQLPAMTTQQS